MADLLEKQSSRDEIKEYQEKVVKIDRVTKVITGGKKMGFRATVVVGNQNGEVGLGVGKASEVSSAIRKGVEKAKKSLVKVSIVGGTITHDIYYAMGASKVLLKPAPRGTGVIAGGPMRIVFELAGIKDIVAKSLGSQSPIGLGRATIEALKNLKTKESEEKFRGKKLDIKYVGEKGEE